MKTSLRALLLVVGVLFFITSCEFISKEDLDSVTDDELLELAEPFDGVEEIIMKRPQAINAEKPNFLIQSTGNNSFEKLRSVTRGRRFGDDATNSEAQAEFEASVINCGSTKSGSTEDYEFNTNDDDFYRRHNLSTNLNGKDRSYYIFVSTPKNYTFKLTGANQNLALLLFKADITSPADNGSDEATEETQGLVAYSTSNSTSSEQLGPVYLDKGEYVLVVDSKPGAGSSFNLEVSCRNAFRGCSGTFGNGLISETFEQYTPFQDIAQHSSNWEDYSPQRGAVAQVLTAGGKGRVLGLVGRFRGNPTFLPYEPDVVFLLGERNSGDYALEFDLGVYRGRSAYFNLINVLTERNANNQVGAEFFFPSFGNAYVLIGGQKKFFSYRNGYWEKIKLVWDFGGNKVSLYINNVKKADWPANALNDGGTGTKSVEGVNFVPAFNNSYFLADNFCFSKD